MRLLGFLFVLLCSFQILPRVVLLRSERKKEHSFSAYAAPSLSFAQPLVPALLMTDYSALTLSAHESSDGIKFCFEIKVRLRFFLSFPSSVC